MQKFTTLIIIALLGSAILWADEEATQSTQDTKKSQNVQESTDTFQPYVNKNKKSQNVSGVYVGVDLGLTGSTTTMRPSPFYELKKDGLALGSFGDVKVGYKHYFTEKFAVRGYVSLGAGLRYTAIQIIGWRIAETYNHTTTALRLGIGADAVYNLSSNVGVFAGFGVDRHSWTHSVSSTGSSSSTRSETEGSTVIPKLQLGLIFSGFEIAAVYHTATVQPANSYLDYGNDIALKVGYTYTFFTL